jgi:putative ABC transport system permease protein
MLTSFWQSLKIDEAIGSLFQAIGLGEFVPKTWGILIIMLLLAYIVKKGIDYFLKTDIGLAIRATGDNETMIRSFSADTDFLKIIGLGLANAMVAFSGALIAQYNGFSDVGMGIGMIVIGLASVIIGEAIFGAKKIVRATLAVIGGSILYRLIVTMALRVEFLETGDMKLITAIIVIFALVLPKINASRKERQRKKKRMLQSIEQTQALKVSGTRN